MELLSEKDKTHLRKYFDKEMKDQITIIYFTQGATEDRIDGKPQCLYCRETLGLLNEIASLSNLIKLEVYDFVSSEELAKKYQVDKIPGILILNKEFKPLKFYGIPAGYEFQAILETIIMVSQNKTKLKDSTRNRLKELSLHGKHVSIQVFVTPTCPYCTKMVTFAYQFALESPFIESVIIEATEFPYLADKYGVFGVPKTIINEVLEIEGAVSEETFLDYIIRSIKS